jgi:transposase
MPAPISMDLRLRIVHAVERGSSIRAAARRFAVSPSAAIKLMQRLRATGSAAPARYGEHRRPLLAPHEAELRRLVETTPDVTLAELRAELKRRCGVVAGVSTIHNALRRIGLRHEEVPKSRGAGPPRRREQAPAVADLAALHGPGAVHLPRRDRHGHQPGQALRPQPVRRTAGGCHAPRSLADHHLHRGAARERHRRPITGPAFRAYVEQLLAPALEPGDVVVLDNHTRSRASAMPSASPGQSPNLPVEGASRAASAPESV